jgi:UDP-glucose 4-epimerase
LPDHFPKLEIIMIDNLSSQRFFSLFNLPPSASFNFLEEDLTKFDLSKILKENDIVIHLAAMTDAASSFVNAEKLDYNNFVSTSKVAQACNHKNAKLIFISSTSVYGSQNKIVDENCNIEDLNPQSPYAQTKIREENLITQLTKNSGLKSVIFRFGTIFGVSPGMRFHTAVNKFCWQAAMGRPLTIWRTAYDQNRPYLDLDDALSAISLIISKSKFSGELYNVLTMNISVRRVIEVIREYKPNLDIQFVNNEIMNQLSYNVSFSRISNLGYSPKGDLKKSIKMTLDVLKQANTEVKFID